MTQELKRTDISSLPQVAHLAREVRARHEPQVLTDGEEELAVVSPLPAPKKRRSKGRPLTEDDPLFKLVGIGASHTPGGVAGRKHEALAEAYRRHLRA